MVLFTRSLVMIFCLWRSTVCLLIFNCSAIVLLDVPVCIICNIIFPEQKEVDSRPSEGFFSLPSSYLSNKQLRYLRMSNYISRENNLFLVARCLRNKRYDASNSGIYHLFHTFASYFQGTMRMILLNEMKISYGKS